MRILALTEAASEISPEPAAEANGRLTHRPVLRDPLPLPKRMRRSHS